MEVPLILLLCGLALVCAQDEDDDDLGVFGDLSSNKPCSCEGRYPCFCVQDNQCLPNGTINYYGAGDIIPFRHGGADSDTTSSEGCSEDETCCQHIKGEVIEPTLKPNTPSPDRSKCGTRGPSIGAGTKTARGEFPWMLAIFYRDWNVWKFRCGASLIKKNIILTAAHCVSEFKSKPWALRVRAGVWNLYEENDDDDDDSDYGNTGDDEEKNIQELDVAKVLIHEDYIERKLHNDIALLVLADNFQRLPNLGTVCIPQKRNLVPEGSSCIITGWGQRRYGSVKGAGPQLKKITVPLVARDTCESRLKETGGKRKEFRLHDSFLCAGGEHKKDACTGDGGGPLVCEVNRSFIQVGIVSWGIGCGKAALPGVYVDVAKYYNWMREKIKQEAQ